MRFVVTHIDGDGPGWVVRWVDAERGPIGEPIAAGTHPAVDVLTELGVMAILRRELEPSTSPHVLLYGLDDGNRLARLPLDWHVQFNAFQRWPVFVAHPPTRRIYVYRPETLGDHRSRDFIRGIDLDGRRIEPWQDEIPQCVMGWSGGGGEVHAQMLFVADGLDVGELPEDDFGQRVGFWGGPDRGMLDVVDIGPRPRAHSDLGHARAIDYAPAAGRSVVVCNDGKAIVLDATTRAVQSVQQVDLGPWGGMPNFAARVDHQGRRLFVGAATHRGRTHGHTEAIVVHDLERRTRVDIVELTAPLRHWTISPNGAWLFGGCATRDEIVLIDTADWTIARRDDLAGQPTAVQFVG